MKRVITALVLIPIVLVLVFLGPRWQWLFTLAVAAIAALAGWEYMALSRRCGANPPRVATMVALLALIALPTLREQANGPSLVVFLLFVVWAGDTAAYYAGRAWGRHKMAPSLSPGKTWEGAIASVAGSVLVAAALVALATVMQEPSNSAVLSWLERVFPSAVLAYPDEIWYWLGLAAIINVAGQVGDLAESALKRSAGVKDSGNLLPGHGGVLDRIDALLLAGPVLWYAQVIHQRF